MLAVEVDGWESRNTYRAFQSDTDRQNAITLAGWAVIRFTWTDVVRRPGYVAGQIAAGARASRDGIQAMTRCPSPGKVGCRPPTTDVRSGAISEVGVSDG